MAYFLGHHVYKWTWVCYWNGILRQQRTFRRQTSFSWWFLRSSRIRGQIFERESRLDHRRPARNPWLALRRTPVENHCPIAAANSWILFFYLFIFNRRLKANDTMRLQLCLYVTYLTRYLFILLYPLGLFLVLLYMWADALSRLRIHLNACIIAWYDFCRTPDGKAASTSWFG